MSCELRIYSKNSQLFVNEMKLYVLGSGTCVPYDRRGSSGYAIKLQKTTILLDCGNGITWKLGKVGIDYLEVDYIFLSHFHPDHTSDLIPFLFATKHTQSKRKKPLHIFGAKGLMKFFSALKEAYREWIVPPELSICEIEEGILEFDDYKLTAKKTVHTESSQAYRIDSEGKSLVYSGDTDYSESLIELARNTDALVIECSAPDEKSKIKGHLAPNEVAQIANQSMARKVIITHLYPICDESNIVSSIREQVEADVIIAEDLMAIEI